MDLRYQDKCVHPFMRQVEGPCQLLGVLGRGEGLPIDPQGLQSACANGVHRILHQRVRSCRVHLHGIQEFHRSAWFAPDPVPLSDPYQFQVQKVALGGTVRVDAVREGELFLSAPFGEHRASALIELFH